MMLDLVSGRAASPDALHIEDAVLQMLIAARRRTAEAALHAAKAHSDDLHFESHFYASVSFGIPEQMVAQRDPNRLTYAQHGLTSFDPAAVEARLQAGYTPAAVRATVRTQLFESQDAGAQQLREKLVDWLAAHVPDGVLPEGSSAERREHWLHVLCHDAE
eukprot:2699640-Prymnesium_polylepis.1